MMKPNRYNIQLDDCPATVDTGCQRKTL